MKKLKRSVSLIILLFITSNLTLLKAQDILISEVSLCTNQVELFNAGSTTVDISSWLLCNRNAASGGPFYASISNLTTSGSTTLLAGNYITINWTKIEGPVGELGLYINAAYTNPASLVDYIQFNGTGSNRSGVAVSAGVWDNSNAFVTVDYMAGCATVIANASDPASSNSTTWCDAISSTLGTANSACAIDEILISEVSLCTNQVELLNAGQTTVDISSWFLCNLNGPGSPYASISSLTTSGSTTLLPGDYITIDWNQIVGPTGELGLYIDSNFGSSASIHDYMQYNAGGNGRASVAVAAGVWDNTASFVTVDDMPGCSTVIANAANPSSSTSTTWCTAASNTLGSSNSACAIDEILISEVSLCTNQVELFNVGQTTVDISSWFLCNRNAASGGPFYATISSLTTSGSTTLSPGDYIVIDWTKIEGPTGELGLYIDSNFGSSASIHDYMQFNQGNNFRASVAVAAGVWDNAASFVTVDDMPGCSTVNANASDPASTNSTTWCTAASNTLGSTNSACMMTMSNCPDDYANGGLANSMPPLTGTQATNADFETDGMIISDQVVGPAVVVDYDSGTSIEMISGFETLGQTTFHAFIDGCMGAMFQNTGTR